MTELYAFWEYDQFPGFLGGKVDKVNDTGEAFIESYRAWFPYFALEVGERGRAMVELGERLRQVRKAEDLRVRTMFEQIGCDLISAKKLPQVPRSRLWHCGGLFDHDPRFRELKEMFGFVESMK